MRTEKKSNRSRMDPIIALVLIFAVLKVTGLIHISSAGLLELVQQPLFIFLKPLARRVIR